MNNFYLDLEPARLKQAKAAYTTRHVDFDALTQLLTGDLTPKCGDLVLARVEEIGQHKQIELSSGRKASLFPGDEIVVCYGNRYAPDQFEAEVPLDLSPCNLVAAGGLAAIVLSQHIKVNPATTITPIGLLADSNGQRVNLANWALKPTTYIGQRPFTVAVLGTSMNSGKTTTAANLIKGLVLSGLKVGAAKITGTGAGNDIWLMRDAGASLVLDFTYVGFPSTYRATPQEVETILDTLTSHLAGEGVDVIVLEIADGLYQYETSKLISSVAFRNTVDGVLFATNSALGATAGVELLQLYQLPVLAISGTVTTSPLAARETAIATGLPVLDLEMLRTQAAALTSRLLQPQIALSV
ncbi:P-loop NTPase family protein [Mastigocladopsis repens]|uniref:hypothetical protein n=1 Tax=Mastigocladopsis repens TaxID=221287 RepID=UPI000307277E|nr:hypothetical protein [Mastigocladopsis repens]